MVLLSAAAFAQNGRYDNVAQGPKGPIPNATIAVCTQPANTTTTPCTPLANLCSSLSDTTCGQPNPFTSDTLGNFHFYAVGGQPYTVQIYGPQVAAPFALTDQSVNINTGSGTIAASSINGVLHVNPFGPYTSIALAEAVVSANPTSHYQIVADRIYAGTDCPAGLNNEVFTDERASAITPTCGNNAVSWLPTGVSGTDTSFVRFSYAPQTIATNNSEMFTHYYTVSGALPTTSGSEAEDDTGIVNSAGTITGAGANFGLAGAEWHAYSDSNGSSIGNQYGVITGVGTRAGTTTVGTAYGMLVQTPLNAAAITNDYGIYIQPQNVGTTTNLGLYSASPIQMQSASPTTGTNNALTGFLNMPNNQAANSTCWRNVGNNADICFYLNSGNTFVIPSPAALSIGGGSAINEILTGSATLTYTSMAANTTQGQNMTITGASTTNKGVFCSPLAGLGTNAADFTWAAWVSATNTVTVVVANVSTAASVTPAAVSWGCTVSQ